MSPLPTGALADVSRSVADRWPDGLLVCGDEPGRLFVVSPGDGRAVGMVDLRGGRVHVFPDEGADSVYDAYVLQWEITDDGVVVGVWNRRPPVADRVTGTGEGTP